MQANEALEILGLKPGATPEEIKEHYRDLVKVWHPDRFGSDPRLRRKADEKLSEINDAYRALRDYDGTAVHSTDFSWADSAVDESPTAKKARKHRIVDWREWAGPILRGLAGLLVVALGTYFYFLVHPRTVASPSAAEQSPASTPATTGTSASAAGDARLRKSTAHTDSAIPQAAPQPFQVRVLSEGDSAQIEAVCGTAKRLRGTAAYASCVQSEMALLEKNAEPTQNLSGLSSAEERDAIEAVCSADKLRHDDLAYARCISWQKSDLDSSSGRPDFSGISEADRKSMETACSDSKKLGPVAYDHCLMRMIQTLAGPKR